MKLISSILIAALGFAAPLYARLGETERQCITRYGSARPGPKIAIAKPDPLVSGAREAIYEYQGWKIRAAFIGDRVVAEEYRKPYDHPNGTKILEAEIAAILGAESEGLTWGRPHLDTSKDVYATIANVLMSPFSDAIWDRSDGAKATLRVQSALVLESSEAIRAKASAAKQKAEGKLKRVPKF